MLLSQSTAAFNNILLWRQTIRAMHDSATRLYEAAKALRRTEGQSAVARLLNESPQTVKNWETRGVSRQGAIKAQNLIGCNAHWVLTGAGTMAQPVSDPPIGAPLFAREEPRTEYQPVRPDKIRVVPVVGQGAGGQLPERIWTDGDFPTGATHEYAEVASTDPHAFVTKVVGPSMIPKYMPGEYAMVEPSTEPDLEDDVLVRLASGATMLKRLLSRRGGHVRLGSYNSDEVLTYEAGEIVWMYYVPYPVPARKIKTRV